MKNIFSAILLLSLIVSCNDKPTLTMGQQANPLSNRDPKVGLSPEERFGELFDSVQASTLFADPKMFLDCLPKSTTDSIMEAFKEAKSKPDFSLQSFVNQWFTIQSPPADAYTSDLLSSPESHISDLWKVLARPADTFNLSTLIALPKPYILSNGRAKEVQYKEAYFIMLGLQAAGRMDIVENMVDNFAYLINTEGYVPSANRTYYLGRSQPPFFACMVQLLASEKGETVLTKYLPQLESEYNYWMEGAQKDAPKDIFYKNHVVQVDRNTMNRYFCKDEKPRPEKYRADRDSVKKSARPEKETYRHIRAGSESGWDFSSRWLDTDKQGGTYKVSNIHTSDILPIDLNALLYNLEMTISKAKVVEKKYEEATAWEKKASHRREALMRYCWSESKGMFFDFDWQKYRQTDVISAAMVYPLFFKMVTKRDADRVVSAIQQHLLRAGGIVTTVNRTGHAWDAPNGYAPLQWLTIKGLRNYGHEETANDIKKRWCDLNVKVFRTTGRMLEKYNVEDLSIESGGGDYPVHDGYGWTNGVLLRLLMEE
jgi:alpha,alpha-trehalase